MTDNKAFQCPPPEPDIWPLTHAVGVGFGGCVVTADGFTVYDENNKPDDLDYPILDVFEQLARLAPWRKWEIRIDAPLANYIVTRTNGKWLCRRVGDGFA